jgi:hypothetical protein
MADRSAMPSAAVVRKLMPLMREFGDLARKRVGVTPLEYQRYRDLKSQIGRRISREHTVCGGDRNAFSRQAVP